MTPPRRILVVLGTKGIGDAAEASSVPTLVRRHWPDTEVTVGVFNAAQEVVMRGAADVADVVRVHGHPRDNRRALRALVGNTLLLRRFDRVLMLDRTERAAWPLVLASWLAGAPLRHRHGYHYRDRRKSPFADFPAHVFFQLVTAQLLLRSPLGEVVPPRVEPAEAERSWAQALFVERSWTARPVVLLNTRGPQYGVSMGRWGIEHYLQLANLLVAADVTVVVNGGSAAQVREFRDAEHLADARVQLLERPDVGQLAAVLARCTVVVGEPSGPLCLAAAVGAPTVTLQGPGERDFPGHNRSGPVWWPYDPRHLSVSRVAWCLQVDGSACLCARDTKSRVKQRLEPLHLWKPYKKTLARFGLFDRLHPSRWTDRTFRCLERLTPEEVAVAVLGHLAANPGTPPSAAPQTSVRSTPKASA